MKQLVKVRFIVPSGEQGEKIVQRLVENLSEHGDVLEHSAPRVRNEDPRLSNVYVQLMVEVPDERR